MEVFEHSHQLTTTFDLGSHDMAISNITNFIAKSAFPAFLIPSAFRRKHENISRSQPKKTHYELLLSGENANALKMLTKSYCFRYRDDSLHHLQQLGVMRVSAVVINDLSSPEIGLSSLSDDKVDFYFLSDLLVLHEVVCIN